MAIKLSDVKGLILEKKNIYESNKYDTHNIAVHINNTIAEQSSRKISLNLDKLKQLIINECCKCTENDDGIDCIVDTGKLADAILKEESDLIEYVEDK